MRVNPEFLEWAAQYDTGAKEGRSLAKHRAWLLARRCPVLELCGDIAVDEKLMSVLKHVRDPSVERTSDVLRAFPAAAHIKP